MKKTDSQLYKTLQKIPEDFVFLFVGMWIGDSPIGEDRKNVSLLIKAFYEIFKNKQNPPALLLKTSKASASNIDRHEILRKINIIKRSVPSQKIPNVYLLHGDLKDSEMNELYNHPKIKAMVSLTKGEGFGKPLLEFSFIGKPIISSGWSGQIDFLKPEFTGLIGGELKPIHPSAQVKNILIPDSSWFYPDLKQIGYFFLDVYNNYDQWKEKAEKQKHYSETNFNFDEMKKKLGDILDKIPEFPTEVKLSLPSLNQTSNVKEIKLPKLKKLK